MSQPRFDIHTKIYSAAHHLSVDAAAFGAQGYQCVAAFPFEGEIVALFQEQEQESQQS